MIIANIFHIYIKPSLKFYCMKKSFLSILCLLLVNFVFAQVTDTTKTKTTTTKTTKTIKKTTTTTIVTTEKIDTIYKNDTIYKKSSKIRVVATEKKNIIKLTTFGINYERVLGSRITAQLNTHYLFSGQATRATTTNEQELRTESSGFAVGAEVRFYPKSALNGFFVALSPRYQNYNFRVPNGTNDNNGNPTNAEANWSAYNVAFLLGEQWVFNDIISLDLYIGPAIVGGVLEITKGNRDAFTLFGTGANTGVTLRGGLTLGFAFGK